VGSGIYAYLPLMWKVIQRITAIVREELNAAGAQETLLPQLHPAELWQRSGRWQGYTAGEGIMFHLEDRQGRELGLGPTHEEVVTSLAGDLLQSYKQLPVNLYQVQTKFRDEIRPRFGLMRGREFIMKDAYSFHLYQECLDEWYEKYKKAYNKIFTRLQLEYTMVDADSGNIGGNKSNEFHVIADTGEDDLLIDRDGIGINFEIAKTKYSSHDIKKIIKDNNLVHKKGIEVGHIFKLGDKYSKSMNLSIDNAELKKCNIQMGCYGIGVSRIIAAAIEQNHDENGIIWPVSISPFKIVIIEIDGHKNEHVRLFSTDLYEELNSKGIEVILDDRNAKLGNKLNDWELIGVPNIVIVGKSEAENNAVTFKKKEVRLIKLAYH